MNQEIVKRISDILAFKAPDLPAGDRTIAALVMMHLVKGVVPAVEGQPKPVQQIIVAEFKRVGVLYLEDVITREW